MKAKLSIYVLVMVVNQILSFSLMSLLSYIPSIPSIPAIPKIPSIPSIPNIPNIPEIPSIPELPFYAELIKEKAETFFATLSSSVNEDAVLLVPDLIRKYGYPCETHNTTSPDGYILTLHRIPYGRQSSKTQRRVVYLQHGILSSSADWVISGPGKGLGYILADAGFDVWMGNNRGNRYSNKHRHLNPHSAEYWNFSWHEIGVNDLPVIVDYVLRQTNRARMSYVGHSQGTTAFYVMCAERPEYNDKIEVMFSLAPVGYMSNVASPLLKFISRGQEGLQTIFDGIGMYAFLPHTQISGKIGTMLCSDDSVAQILCLNVLFAICGFSQKQVNTTLLPVIMGHTPAGAATKQLLHYAQEITSGKFRQWDYGTTKNLEIYGTVQPPSYNLSKVKAPVYLIYSRNDWLSSERDVLKLYLELGNLAGTYLVPDATFNHMDFLFGKDASQLIYKYIVNIIVNL